MRRSKQQKKIDRILIFGFGIFIGISIGVSYVSKAKYFNKKSDLEVVKEKLAEFQEIEAICGKGNVRDMCKYGYCNSEIGLTCYHWRKAAYESENNNE